MWPGVASSSPVWDLIFLFCYFILFARKRSWEAIIQTNLISQVLVFNFAAFSLIILPYIRKLKMKYIQYIGSLWTLILKNLKCDRKCSENKSNQLQPVSRYSKFELFYYLCELVWAILPQTRHLIVEENTSEGKIKEVFVTYPDPS